jgi:hypothetical protein
MGSTHSLGVSSEVPLKEPAALSQDSASILGNVYLP